MFLKIEDKFSKSLSVFLSTALMFSTNFSCVLAKSNTKTDETIGVTNNQESEARKKPFWFCRHLARLMGLGVAGISIMVYNFSKHSVGNGSSDKITGGQINKGQEKGSKNADIERVRRIYNQLYNELTYDRDVGNLGKNFDISTITLAALHMEDIELVKNTKRGDCRQFANVLVSELNKIGIWSRLITFSIPNAGSHVATIYRTSDGQYFIADLGQDKQNDLEGLLCSIPAAEYMSINKKRCNVSVEDFWVFEDDPAQANYPVSHMGLHAVRLMNYVEHKNIGIRA